ncbi:hypothetical protein PoB_003851000 [Plakobranchus ocellatus]|uniref:Uncharacterized protein n=1 Tax=Plakobranchus ocellatus TaxID=259542 RepID=A0AAV4AXK7_9GAST|nr:hypothetical protein PoB_003851000 [Plakobranchus ocellatus]
MAAEVEMSNIDMANRAEWVLSIHKYPSSPACARVRAAFRDEDLQNTRHSQGQTCQTHIAFPDRLFKHASFFSADLSNIIPSDRPIDLSNRPSYQVGAGWTQESNENLTWSGLGFELRTSYLVAICPPDEPPLLMEILEKEIAKTESSKPCSLPEMNWFFVLIARRHMVISGLQASVGQCQVRGGARTYDRKVSVHLRADSLATLPPKFLGLPG